MSELQKEQTAYVTMQDQFKKDTGMDAKQNQEIYLQYIKAILHENTNKLLASIHNNLAKFIAHQ